ncbi:hypothetical protein [Pseudomonas sp. MH9.2]|nr:hypothetical protein [Pseudomonas sp. MH9.2]
MTHDISLYFLPAAYSLALGLLIWMAVFSDSPSNGEIPGDWPDKPRQGEY